MFLPINFEEAAQAVGIHLQQVENTEPRESELKIEEDSLPLRISPVYSAVIFYHQEDSKSLKTVGSLFRSTTILPANLTIFQLWGALSGGDLEYMVDLEERNILYSSREEVEKLPIELQIKRKSHVMRSSKEDYHHNISLDKLKNPDNAFQLPNLAVNIINYINAHNVTFRQGTKQILVSAPTPANRNRRVSRNKPFYLVSVRDEERTIEDTAGKSWELNWRIYVRGHDRRYRDENGEITKTSWISPYVKGPPTAPWRHQRYEILADKLMKERLSTDLSEE
jgi:hypothetical protein